MVQKPRLMLGFLVQFHGKGESDFYDRNNGTRI